MPAMKPMSINMSCWMIIPAAFTLPLSSLGVRSACSALNPDEAPNLVEPIIIMDSRNVWKLYEFMKKIVDVMSSIPIMAAIFLFPYLSSR